MPWWGKSSDSKEAKPESQQPTQPANSTDKGTFDPHKLPKAERLPASLQKIVEKADDDSSFFDDVSKG